MLTKKTPEKNTALSEREWEVMLKIASGRTVSEIAKDLFLSVKTISTYRTRILKKTGYTNNVEIAMQAFRQGLINTNE